MAKGTGGFISRFLYSLGESVRFASDTTFAPARSEAPEKGKKQFFLPYRQRFQNAMAKMREQSFFFAFLDSFYRNLFSTRVRSFGMLFFTCGFLQILCYFLGDRIPYFSPSEENLLFGVCQIFIAVLCAFVRGDLGESIRRSFLFRRMISPLFGVAPWRFSHKEQHDSSLSMTLAGVVIGLFSLVFSPIKVFVAFILLVLVLFVFYLPEAGLYITAFFFFFLSSSALTHLFILTLCSFFCKWAIGKRSILLTPVQVMVLVLPSLFFLLGKGCDPVMAFHTAAFCFLISCLIRTVAFIRRFLFSFVLGSLLSAGMILLGQFSAHPVYGEFFRHFDLKAFLHLAPSLENGVFLVLICPLAAGLFRSLRWGGKVVLFPLYFTIVALTLAVFGNLEIWLSLFIALVIFALFSYRWFLFGFLSAGLLFVTAITLFPSLIGEGIVQIFGLFEKASFVTPLFHFYTKCGGIFFWIGLILLTGLFVYGIYRFKADTTHPKVYPLMLGVVASFVSFLYLGFSSVSISFQGELMFVCFLTLSEVNYTCARREEIRLPY